MKEITALMMFIHQDAESDPDCMKETLLSDTASFGMRLFSFRAVWFCAVFQQKNRETGGPGMVRFSFPVMKKSSFQFLDESESV